MIERRKQELRDSTRLRSNELPPNALILLRGGPQDVAELIEAAEDSGERYTLDGEPFYGLSATGVLPHESLNDVLGEPPLRYYRQVHIMRAGDLYIAGFRVWATFRNPRHYDVQLAAPTAQQVTAFLAVAGPPQDNPGYAETEHEEVGDVDE